MDEEKLNKEVAAYQKQLADVIYPNGGQLRDYQAEGVSWMMANYLNGRSSLLADEMGLGYVNTFTCIQSLDPS
jgi:SNF2 family DNA or RNA helicase